MHPQEYSAFSRRVVPAVTWEDLDNRVQFVSLRGFQEKDGKLINFKETLDLYTKKHRLGNVVWPSCPTLNMDNLDDLLNEIKSRGLYLFDIWGYVPGVDPEKSFWGQYTYSETLIANIKNKLGKQFIGIDNGEQDGRYIGGYAPQMYPIHQESRKQYINFYDYFEKLADDLGNHLVGTCSLNFGHYFAHMGNHIMLGSETAQALPNANVWYAYLRGAGKQYGLLWYGFASLWNRNGYKNYSGEGDQYGKCGPEVGTSLNLLRRLMYTHYSYNSAIVGFELGWIYNEHYDGESAGDDNASSELTPVGQVQADCAKIVSEKGMAGVLHTPTAIVLDFYGGWTFPRHLYTKSINQNWGNKPYELGDYQIHSLYSMLYPGYEDSGFYQDERGFLVATPYGDAFDVLFDNAESDIFSMYNLLVLAGKQRLDEEITNNLKEFISDGGSMVIFGEQLKAMNNTDWIGIELNGKEIILTESRISYDNSTFIQDKLTLLGCDISNNIEILALADEHPLILCSTWNKGKIFVIASPYALTQESLCQLNPTVNNENTSLPMLCDLLPPVKAFLADLFNKEKLIDPNNPNLQYTTGWNADDSLMVTLCNNGTDWESYSLESKIGEITQIIEWEMPPCDHMTTGYFPTIIKDKMIETMAKMPEGNLVIPPSHIKVFTLQIDSPQVEMLPHRERREPVKNRILSLWNISDLREELLTRERLGQHFDGIKIEAKYIQSTDINKLRKEGALIKRLGFSVIVDFLGLLNHYPSMTLIDSFSHRWESSRDNIKDTFNKMKDAGFKKAMLSVHKEAECISPEESLASFKKNIAIICDDAQEIGVEILLTTKPSQNIDTSGTELRIGVISEKSIKLIKEIDRPNLGFALDVCHSIIANENILELLKKYNKEISMVCISVPLIDKFGQYYNAHNPAYGSKWEELTKKILKWLLENKSEIPICMNALYHDWNEVFRDMKHLNH